MTLSIKEYDKVVRRFVDDYVDNLTPDQMREIISEQSHIDFENIRQDTGIDSVFEEMRVGIVSYGLKSLLTLTYQRRQSNEF